MMEATENNTLPSNLRGRSIHIKVIPTVCNLKNMIEKLIEVNGDVSKLKYWEKRSYNAYQIEKIKSKLLKMPPNERVDIIRSHILQGEPKNFGASCIDIYLVGFVAENFGASKERFFKYIKDSGISDNGNSAQAIWQVGKGDGVYLKILNNDGTIQDLDFIKAWIRG